MFEQQRLMRIFKNSGDAPAELIERLREAVKAYEQGVSAQDDQPLVAALMSAMAISPPRAAHGAPLRGSRTTAPADCFASKRFRATSPPTLPAIPVIANMLLNITLLWE
jgi:uncharacterized membrane protein